MLALVAIRAGPGDEPQPPAQTADVFAIDSLEGACPGVRSVVFAGFRVAMSAVTGLLCLPGVPVLNPGIPATGPLAAIGIGGFMSRGRRRIRQ